ncbi:MAG: DUF3800 domain-containing protein [Bryobacteraceae bacterium]
MGLSFAKKQNITAGGKWGAARTFLDPATGTARRALRWDSVAHSLFIDESGYDSGPSPYGVLGGVAIEDRDVWNLIKAMQDAEVRYFGTRYSAGRTELKAKKLISAQVFRQASLAEQFAFLRNVPNLPSDALNVALALRRARSRRSLRRSLNMCGRSLRSVRVFGAARSPAS